MTVEELNDAIEEGTIGELIQVAEARQCKDLSKIADLICGRPGIRLVLLAGGSAAGKTTTAKRLATQIRVNGRAALLLSTDDYFVRSDLNPKNEKGEPDFEHVECVDISQLVEDINALFRGEEIPVRRFDFVRHAPYVSDKTLRLPSGGFVILEGIHALNPRLTAGVEDAAKFRVFVQPQPNLDIFAGITCDQYEARFLRRLVRDNQFRRLNPERTFDLWANVIEGEHKWIEPFCKDLDARFNSYLVYELAVLKPYVEGLLQKARLVLGDRGDLMDLLRLLRTVEPISPSLVPGDSIIRETIGGSQLEY